MKAGTRGMEELPWWLAWRPSPAWAVVASGIAIIGVLHLGGQSEFLYWQF
jgi:hypothetical protein